MKKIILFLMLVKAICTYSHEDVVVKKNIGKVQLYSSISDYTEVINQTIIIAEYANIIIDDLHFKDSIQLIIVQGSEKILNVGRDQKNPNKIQFLYSDGDERYFDTKKILNFIYQICKNPKILKKDRGIKEEEVSKDYNYVDKILQTRIDRPNFVEELETMVEYSYYFQNETYYFYKLKNPQKIVYQTKEVYQIQSISSNELLIFPNDKEFVFIKEEEIFKHFHKISINYKLLKYKISRPSHNIIIIGYPNREKVSAYVIDKNLFIEDINIFFG